MFTLYGSYGSWPLVVWSGHGVVANEEVTVGAGLDAAVCEWPWE